MNVAPHSSGLTERQRQIRDFIREHVRRTGTAPSYSEMCQAVGVKSKSAISAEIRVLEDLGFIRRLRGRARAVEVLEAHPAISVTMVDFGRIGDRVAVSQEMLRREWRAAGELVCEGVGVVAGDYLSGFGILSGDRVSFDLFPSGVEACLKDGDIILAKVGTLAYLRSIHHKTNNVLSLSGTNVPTMMLHRDNCIVLGRVNGVTRIYENRDAP